jgi:PAS domain S-box-containing protein
MRPAAKKDLTEKACEDRSGIPKKKKFIRKKPPMRASTRQLKMVPITLHVFRELEFFRDLPDATFVIDRRGTVLVWNRAMEKLTGFSAAEILGKGDFCYAIPFYGERRPILIDFALNTRTQLPELYDNLCCDGPVVTATTRYAHPKGENIILWKRASPIIDENGTTIGAIESIRDITRYQQMKDQLRASEERFRALAENASDIIRVFNREGKIVFDTATSERILGYPPGFSLGADPFEFIHPDDVEMVKCEFSRIYEKSNTGVPTEFRIRKADGSFIWAESVGKNMFGVPGIDGIVTTTRFIDERKKAEMALLKSEERYRSFISHSNEGIFRFEAGGDIPVDLPIDEQIARFIGHAYLAECNNAFARMYGHEKAEELIGSCIGHIMATDSDLTLEYMRMFIRAGYHVENFESMEKDCHGNPRWFSNSLTGILENGKVIRLWGVQRDITERKQAEEALRESKELYQTLADSSPDMIYLIDKTGYIRFVNPVAAALFEMSPVDLIGKKLDEVFAPDVALRHFKAVTRIIITGQPAFSELLEPFPSGDRWIDVWLNPVRDATGEINRVLGISSDITERKLAEEALHIAQEKYSKAFFLAPDVITVSDLESGRFIEVNDAATRTFGYSRDELIGKSSLELGIWPDKEVRDRLVDRIKTHGRVVQLEVVERRNSGELFFASVTADTISIGNAGYLIATTRDITDRKRMEDQIRESEARYRTLIDQLPDYVIVHREGILLYVNPAAATDLLYTEKDLIGKPMMRFIDPDYHEVVKNATMRRTAGEIIAPYEIVITAKDGSKRTFLINGAQIIFEGKPATLNVLTDISIQKAAGDFMQRAKEALEERVTERTWELTQANMQLADEIKARNSAERIIKQSLDEKDLLLREIHHRVKNNLQIIASLLNLQSRYITDRKVLESIRDSQNRVRAMALVHERIYQSHEIGTINLAEYLRYLINQIFRFYNIPQAQVEVAVAIDDIPADIDTAIPVGLIFNELVSNALKHAFPEGKKGKITVKGSQVAPDQLKFTFRDDGIGMPADRDWKKNSSLGLRLVSSLTKQLDGTVDMEQDNGTVYNIMVKPKHPFRRNEMEEKQG